MQFCNDHWQKLGKALDDRGLSHLCAKTTQEIIQNIVDASEEKSVIYDPLSDCHWMIVNRALELGGLYLLSIKQDGTHWCPVCEAIRNGRRECDWIDAPADACLKFCRDSGIVPKPS